MSFCLASKSVWSFSQFRGSSALLCASKGSLKVKKTSTEHSRKWKILSRSLQSMLLKWLPIPVLLSGTFWLLMWLSITRAPDLARGKDTQSISCRTVIPVADPSQHFAVYVRFFINHCFFKRTVFTLSSWNILFIGHVLTLLMTLAQETG